MRRLLRVFTALVVLVVIAGIGGMFWWRWASAAVDPSAKSPHRLTIAPGATARNVATQLRRADLIRSTRVFTYLARGATIEPGVYDFTAAESPAHILRRLSRGDFATIRITFPEGFTVKQIAHRLARLGAISDEPAFLNLVTTQGTTFKASFPLPADLEGYLFPDTYRFPIGATDQQIVQQMITTFDKRVAAPLAGDITASKRSLADVVNVASMVEREAETDGDRAPIAGVIYNRIAKHMHLEIDATVQYAQGVHKTRLLYSDLAIDSPYNTYKIFGLPPGPICNPGLPSIQAAIHPAASDYLYYVATPNRSHVFARTFEEHERNIAIEKRAFAAKKAAAPAASTTEP